ncbi:MAG: 3-deoxy-manno-octulosonate cytidylyltransferase [Candidatus Zixiibacteriota bacterium]
MAPKVVAVIPARLNSTRFPDKVIYPWRGKPLLYYVYREAKKSHKIDRIVVATDSKRVQKALEPFGAEVILTSSRYRTGSDRVAAVMAKTGGDIIVNIQADNLGLKAATLDRVIERMTSESNIRFATLACRLKTDEELFDPNVVKVVVAKDGRALWFSRFPIPFLRTASNEKRAKQFRFLRHIGIYFFRREGLSQFAKWRQTSLEKAESLEQLRILENGEIIKVFKSTMYSVSIDTIEDLHKLAKVYR